MWQSLCVVSVVGVPVLFVATPTLLPTQQMCEIFGLSRLFLLANCFV
jgi:hypothetical protein